MRHLRILLRYHPHHSSVVVLKSILYTSQQVINYLERVCKLTSSHEVDPVLMSNYVFSALHLLTDTCKLRQAVLQKIESCQV